MHSKNSFVTRDLKPVDSKVSVVIPTYNRAQLLAETLDSVYAQTWRAYEVIVVDDGSEDEKIVRVCASYDRLVYRRVAHGGVSAARNAGLAIACGDYVAFLDSDDVWQPRFLERMSMALETTPGAGFAYCDYATFGALGTVRARSLPPEHKHTGNVFVPLIETDFLSTGALVIRRGCLTRVGGFDPDLAAAEDWDLWLRLAHWFNAVYVNAPLLQVRIDSDGLTRNTRQLHAGNLRVLAKWQRMMVGNGPVRRAIRRNIRANHRGLALSHWRAHSPWLALLHYVLALAGGLV